MSSLLRLTAATISGLLLIPAAATADDSNTWVGPGWYVVGEFMFGSTATVAGPFDSQDQCAADLNANNQKYAHIVIGPHCAYEQTDPMKA